MNTSQENKCFPDHSLVAVMEAARIALADKRMFTVIAEQMDLTDTALAELAEKLDAYMNGDLDRFDTDKNDDLTDKEIANWLACPGDLEEIETVEELLEVAGRKLDKAYSHEIVGECVFQTLDNKTYVGCVEFVVSEANPDYVKQIIQDQE